MELYISAVYLADTIDSKHLSSHFYKYRAAVFLKWYVSLRVGETLSARELLSITIKSAVFSVTSFCFFAIWRELPTHHHCFQCLLPPTQILAACCCLSLLVASTYLPTYFYLCHIPLFDASTSVLSILWCWSFQYWFTKSKHLFCSGLNSAV